MERDYRAKIKKLLSLSESPNEHEAKAALLKARILMAEHNLELIDIEGMEKREVRREIADGVTYSKLVNPWCAELSAVIGGAYCCHPFRSHTKGKRTSYVGFIGLDGDIDVCQKAFQYAYGYLKGQTDALRRQYSWCEATERRAIADSYGFGFVRGIHMQLEEQKQQHQEWGLVMVVPQEVEDAASDLRSDKWTGFKRDSIKRSIYWQGANDGKDFNMNAVESEETSERKLLA